MTWDGAVAPDPGPIPLRGWLRVAWRGPVLAATVFGGLALMLLLRLIERPIWGMRRPVTPWITQAVCVTACRILRLRRRVRGASMRGPGALVANHASWLDIFVLNASERLYFVSKAEVAGWPGIGWLARATGTIFVRRDRREAAAQTQLLEGRLAAGHRLLFFPEGTSTDGRRVLPFKTTLFAPFLSERLPGLHIQPVTLVYQAPAGAPPAFHAWWGAQAFGPHLLRMLSAADGGEVAVLRHVPIEVARVGDRKALARAAEAAVRVGMEGARGQPLALPGVLPPG